MKKKETFTWAFSGNNYLKCISNNRWAVTHKGELSCSVNYYEDHNEAAYHYLQLRESKTC